MTFSNYQDVMNFTVKFKLSDAPSGLYPYPGHLKPVAMEKRIDFLLEEVKELVDAVSQNNLSKQADALIDIVYVAMGTAALMSLPWQQLWDDVHRANMNKERLTDPAKGHKVGIGKPSDWVGPNTYYILNKAGYNGLTFIGSKGKLTEENCYDFV
jgi:predicted HAD superfamily Cof-like phosphohydrolase